MNAPAPGLDYGHKRVGGDYLEIPLAGNATEESAECVLQMIADLKSYHRRRIFSHKERFGTPDPLSEKALQDLACAHESATRLIEEARENSMAVTLVPTLKISVAAVSGSASPHR